MPSMPLPGLQKPYKSQSILDHINRMVLSVIHLDIDADHMALSSRVSCLHLHLPNFFGQAVSPMHR